MHKKLEIVTPSETTVERFWNAEILDSPFLQVRMIGAELVAGVIAANSECAECRSRAEWFRKLSADVKKDNEGHTLSTDEKFHFILLLHHFSKYKVENILKRKSYEI